MAKDSMVKLTVEEGQKLFITAAFAQMPEKLGDAHFSMPERNGINQELGRLFVELKSYSPLMQKNRVSNAKLYAFGPEDCWDPAIKDGKIVDYNYVDPRRLVQVRLSPDALNGAVWALILQLHPASSMVARIADQMEIYWPIAEKLKKAEAVRKEIGADKATHRRFDDDPEEDASEEGGNGKSDVQEPQEAKAGT